MNPIRILVDSFADAGLPNAQMGNAREIVARLDPDVFHVSMFKLGEADARIRSRKNTRLIQLPRRRQTARILSEFLCGRHQLLFYMKSSPASRWYVKLRQKWNDRRTTIGTIESQSNIRQQTGVHKNALRLYEQTILRCDYLFSNSAAVRNSLAREYGIASQVIPTGVDAEFFSPDWERAQNLRPQVLFVGSLRPFKQPQFLLSAALRFPQADFRIAGGGPLAEELAARITHERITNAKLLGPMQASQLRDEYRRADVFLFPSQWEGSPKVVLEAMACGLPVIIRNTYSSETVLDGITGFQAKSDDELYSSLQLLLAHPELRSKFGRAGRRHSLTFDWGVIVPLWQDAFLHLSRGEGARRAS